MYLKYIRISNYLFFFTKIARYCLKNKIIPIFCPYVLIKRRVFFKDPNRHIALVFLKINLFWTLL